ncbi:DNA cytosine methyltransferase [Weeksellaceae bacterium KMM 9713]|uniref:Cytosine-specific methyltransferase n=1 Tax=Profundicola chukchiensis TaxID=2961959 RepID=A0A9X4N0E8_9FLAO|nr:DNA cytosine methyltransferase [Profundicola chukchiensis]MDG4946367.1 DNA cytosine methyltransferase [Profundicola chukchiensis]
MSKKLRVFEAFAGYGGASFGLKKSGIPFEVIGFSENDKFASEIFELNHPGIRNYNDITKIKPKELPDFDLFTGGFPCQPFSSAGLGKGELDIRGTLFYDIIRICKVKKPKHILLENVKGLTTKRHKDTFAKIKEELRKIGYSIEWKLLNTKDYGIPQNRERVWIYAYLGDLPSGFTIDPGAQPLTARFKDFLDKEPPEKIFLNDKQIARLEELHKVDFNVNESLCLDIYNKKIRHDGTCITITEPHHNSLRVVHPPKDGKYIVRKLSIPEHYRLMGFDDGEFNFGSQSYQQLCKRAGNGWDVSLVGKIFKKIFSQL